LFPKGLGIFHARLFSSVRVEGGIVYSKSAGGFRGEHVHAWADTQPTRREHPPPSIVQTTAHLQCACARSPQVLHPIIHSHLKPIIRPPSLRTVKGTGSLTREYTSILLDSMGAADTAFPSPAASVGDSCAMASASSCVGALHVNGQEAGAGDIHKNGPEAMRGGSSAQARLRHDLTTVLRTARRARNVRETLGHLVGELDEGANFAAPGGATVVAQAQTRRARRVARLVHQIVLSPHHSLQQVDTGSSAQQGTRRWVSADEKALHAGALTFVRMVARMLANRHPAANGGAAPPVSRAAWSGGSCSAARACAGSGVEGHRRRATESRLHGWYAGVGRGDVALRRDSIGPTT